MLKNVTNDEMNKILENHLKWVSREDGGERADLQGANLQGANLHGAILRGAKDVPYIPFACPDSGSFFA